MDLPLIPWLIAFLVSSIVIYYYARPVPELGISALMSYLVISAFGLSIWLLPKMSFSAGVLSALFGADILHLKDIEKIGSGVVSIGGAGTFDGIFLMGVFAVIFSLFLI